MLEVGVGVVAQLPALIGATLEIITRPRPAAAASPLQASAAVALFPDVKPSGAPTMARAGGLRSCVARAAPSRCQRLGNAFGRALVVGGEGHTHMAVVEDGMVLPVGLVYLVERLGNRKLRIP